MDRHSEANLHSAIGIDVLAMIGISGCCLHAENNALRQCNEASSLPETIPACKGIRQTVDSV